MKWVKHGLCHLLAHRTLELRPDYQNMEDFMYSIPERFAAGEGTVVYKGRNELRKMTYGGLDLVVKSFHRPNRSIVSFMAFSGPQKPNVLTIMRGCIKKSG